MSEPKARVVVWSELRRASRRLPTFNSHVALGEHGGEAQVCQLGPAALPVQQNVFERGREGGRRGMVLPFSKDRCSTALQVGARGVRETAAGQQGGGAFPRRAILETAGRASRQGRAQANSTAQILMPRRHLKTSGHLTVALHVKVDDAFPVQGVQCSGHVQGQRPGAAPGSPTEGCGMAGQRAAPASMAAWAALGPRAGRETSGEWLGGLKSRCQVPGFAECTVLGAAAGGRARCVYRVAHKKHCRPACLVAGRPALVLRVG